MAKAKVKDLKHRTIVVDGTNYVLIESNNNGAEVWSWKECIGYLDGLDVFDEAKIPTDKLAVLIKKKLTQN